jgi:hypothetical protein
MKTEHKKHVFDNIFGAAKYTNEAADDTDSADEATSNLIRVIRGSYFGCGLAALCFLCSVFPLAAHHGTGGIYNMEKSVTLRGTVTMFKFVNPHVLLYFDVSDKGATVNWLGEGPSVNNWTRAGWNRNSVKAGDEVTVTLYPARNGKHEGVVHKVVTANGREWCCETK